MERVAALYEGTVCARSFREDLEAHLLNGYVFSTPEFFVMGRAVWSGGATEEIRNPWHVFPVERRDAWLIYVFSGNVNTCLQFFPYPLRYVAWERNGKNGLRFLALEKFLKCWARCGSR